MRPCSSSGRRWKYVILSEHPSFPPSRTGSTSHYPASSAHSPPCPSLLKDNAPRHTAHRRRPLLPAGNGMGFNPFNKQNLKEKYAFPSEDHRQMQERLEYLKRVRGIGVFTARPGMGKTYALRCFMKGLNPNQYQTAYICLSTISVSEFYRQLCDILRLEACGSKTGRILEMDFSAES